MLFSTELLSEKIEKLEVRISDLETENKSLCLENADLKDKLGLNSKTSSIPSSKEFYKKQKATKSKSNRSRGGQTGHQGSSRKKMQADEVINLELTDKVCSCGGKYEPAGEAHIHQTVDIPEVLPHVKEYHLNRYSCNSCGKKKKAILPKGVGADVFGPRINTIVGALTSFYKNSKRDVQNILQDVFNLNISLGSISNVEAKISGKCKASYEDLESQVCNSDIVHMDETSHYNSGKLGWCWMFTSSIASFIKLTESRGKKVLQNSVFGPEDNIVISDRYAAYNYFAEENRQICWAHLRRDFARFAHSENKEVQRFGLYLCQIAGEVFTLKKALLTKEIGILVFMRRIRKLRKRTWNYLRAISVLPDAKKAVGMAGSIMKSEDMMWRFLYDPYNIPLTNNHAERQIRHYVVYRKNSYFTQSERGTRFLERLISLYLTCKQQNLNPFKELTKLATA